MGVPDALRALDDDLAAGRVDADEYRRRRDEVLAAERRSASLPGPVPAPPSPGPTRTGRSGSAPVPPLPGRTPSPPTGSADPTRGAPVVSAGAAGGATERTHVMPGRAVARPPDPLAAIAPPWTAGPAPGSTQLRRRSGAELFVRPDPRPGALVSTTLVVLVAVFVVIFAVTVS